MSFWYRCLWLSVFLYHFTYISAQGVADAARQQLATLGNPEYQGNSIVLLRSAQEKYDSLFRSIGSAERFINIEYFWIGNDSVGNVMTSLLAQKAAQGVEVRMLIDDYANHKSDNPWTRGQVDSLCSLGIKTAMFDKFRFPYINHVRHRDHRKIVVIDGRRVFAGGMNVADYYLTGTERSGQWRDMHFLIDGPAVDEYERVFGQIWKKVTGEELDTAGYTGQAVPCGTTTVSIVNREPGRMSRSMRKAYATAIDAAQEEIRIVNPYPTNVRMVRRAMHRALGRGVRLMVMVSATSDISVVPDVVGIEMKKLVKRGAEVYYYEGGFHHGKTMTVDGEFCTIGSANIDGRSMKFDYEINAFAFDRETTRGLNEVFDSDLMDCEQLTRHNFCQRFTLWHRIEGRVCGVVKNLF